MTDHPAPRTTPRPAASRHPLAPLFQVGTVNLRCAQVLQSIRNNLSAHYRLDAAALQRLADQVLQQLHTAPAVQAAPLWQHLQAGGVDRLAELTQLLAGQPAHERARAWADLAFVGVLLSADPGPRWRCTEQAGVPAAASVQADADDLLALLDRAGKTARTEPPPAAASAAPAAPPAAAGADADAGSTAGADAAQSTGPDAVQPAEAGPANAPHTSSADAAPVPSPSPAPPPSASAASAAAAAPAPAASTTAPPAPESNTTGAAPLGGAEGLAVATFRAFVAGAFSADRSQPCRVDAATLRHVDVAALRALFQGTPQNPLPGLEGRAAVLSRLGQLLQALPGAGGAQARPCDLLPLPAPGADAAPPLQAPALLSHLLRQAAGIWPAPLAQGLPAGDAWQHLWAGAAMAPDTAPAGTAAPDPTAPGLQDRVTSGWVPLHAKAQELVATLALPLAQAGSPLQGLEHLTACTDQPTSSLLLATGVLVPRHPRLLSKALKVADEAVVECRAATVAVFAELTARARSAQPAVVAADGHPLTVAQVVQAAAAVVAAGPGAGAGAGAPALRIEGDGALF